MFSQAVYTTNVTLVVYIDGVEVGSDAGNGLIFSDRPLRGGRVVIGRLYAHASDDSDQSYAYVAVDWLTIWDRPLTEEERNLVH